MNENQINEDVRHKNAVIQEYPINTWSRKKKQTLPN